MNAGNLLAAVMPAVVDSAERELEHLLDTLGEAPPRLVAAMRHACLGGGKRFRPLLVAAAGNLFDAEAGAVRRAGAAVELLHCYSLVHDDLPAMDDAELRRGRPSCHKAFGEATAILAGDALQALAFEALVRTDWPATAAQRSTLTLGLARAAGALGMCGGQLLDLEAEGRELGLEQVAELQARKTGALIAFAVEAGCVLGDAGEGEHATLAAFACDLGLAFQIRDDLLDVEGEASSLGKATGQDGARGKATFVGLLGVEGARARLAELEGDALVRLDIFGGRATLLRELFSFVINRKS